MIAFLCIAVAAVPFRTPRALNKSSRVLFPSKSCCEENETIAVLRCSSARMRHRFVLSQMLAEDHPISQMNVKLDTISQTLKEILEVRPTTTA